MQNIFSNFRPIDNNLQSYQVNWNRNVVLAGDTTIAKVVNAVSVVFTNLIKSVYNIAVMLPNGGIYLWNKSVAWLNPVEVEDPVAAASAYAAKAAASAAQAQVAAASLTDLIAIVRFCKSAKTTTVTCLHHASKGISTIAAGSKVKAEQVFYYVMPRAINTGLICWNKSVALKAQAEVYLPIFFNNLGARFADTQVQLGNKALICLNSAKEHKNAAAILGFHSLDHVKTFVVGTFNNIRETVASTSSTCWNKTAIWLKPPEVEEKGDFNPFCDVAAADDVEYEDEMEEIVEHVVKDYQRMLRNVTWQDVAVIAYPILATGAVLGARVLGTFYYGP